MQLSCVFKKKRHPTPTVIKYPDRTTHPHSLFNYPHIRPILHIAAWVIWQHKIPSFLVWKGNFKDEVIVQGGSWLDSLYFLLIYFLKLCTHVLFFSFNLKQLVLWGWGTSPQIFIKNVVFGTFLAVVEVWIFNLMWWKCFNFQLLQHCNCDFLNGKHVMISM